MKCSHTAGIAAPDQFFHHAMAVSEQQPDPKPVFATVWKLLKLTTEEWLSDNAPQLGAALAYYTVFSLAPLVLILLAVIGVVSAGCANPLAGYLGGAIMRRTFLCDLQVGARP